MHLSFDTRRALKQRLAELLSDPDDIRRLARDVGLPPEQLRPGLAADAQWDAVLDLLERQTLKVRLAFLSELQTQAPVLTSEPLLTRVETEWCQEGASPALPPGGSSAPVPSAPTRSLLTGLGLAGLLLAVVAVVVALGRWPKSDEALSPPPSAAPQVARAEDDMTPPPWSPVPLSLIWLEDPENPDLRLSLEVDPVARRKHLLERRKHLLELVTVLLERDVKGIAMDLDFSADDPEGRDFVEKLLVRAHAQVPRVPVMVVGGNNPLFEQCPVPGQGSACFDLLADAHVQFPSPLEGQPFTRLDACIAGRVSLSAGLAAWIEKKKQPLPLKSVCVGDRSVTPSAAPKQLIERAQVRELASGAVLRGEAPAAFVLVGLKREGDRHTVQFSGSSDVEEEGPRILASGAVSFLREAPMPSSRGDHP